MKFSSTLALPLLMAVPAVVADACQYFDQNPFGGDSGITFRYYNDNPAHWTWGAQDGDAVIQDDGWVFFDGEPLRKTAEMIIQYKGGKKAMVQPPNGMNGWCTLPSGGQYNIENVWGSSKAG